MTLALITALLLPPTAAAGPPAEEPPAEESPAEESPAEAEIAADCNTDFIALHRDDEWRPRARWERTVNIGYAQYQRIRLEAGIEYIVESCSEVPIEDIRISVYDSRAMLRIQSWSDSITFVAPRSGDFSIGVDTALSDQPPADIMLQLSSAR